MNNLHYDSINDLSWQGTNMLAIASSDGFVSFLKFEADTIGLILPPDSPLVPTDIQEYHKG